MNILLYFLQAILCPDHTNQLKKLLITDFAIVTEDGLFWFSIVTSPQLICDWHYEVIFIDCSCRYKLPQRRSSLVNNSHEYEFLTILLFTA